MALTTLETDWRYDMARFIKSKIDRVAYNRDYISYIRMIKRPTPPGNYDIVIGYAPSNDAYSEQTLARDLNVSLAEQEMDRYLQELEEEPLQEYFGDVIENRGNIW